MSCSYAQTQNNCPICNGKEFFILVRLHEEEERGRLPFVSLGKGGEVGEYDGRCLHLPVPGSSVCIVASAWHAKINFSSLQGSC